MYDLKIYTRTEDLLNKFYPRLVNYPNSEKFSLCEHIKEAFFDILGNISLASKVRSKRVFYAQHADAHLQKLKVLVKLSKNRKYISVGFYRDVDKEITEIGKMISGYIRSVNK